MLPLFTKRSSESRYVEAAGPSPENFSSTAARNSAKTLRRSVPAVFRGRPVSLFHSSRLRRSMLMQC